ncbi:hypothetical protein [Luteolibacter luteus]|uniref:Molecular chaperone n=1 Tax=Luteolibacter luteus TaxID=2728835 RepID=A0A858RKB9_9BACT|nr:hypothetical protein [Luteolibacter luteus]QJE97302.1 hypothetical protein HHL09_16410 [Luteolibacter luteus]
MKIRNLALLALSLISVSAVQAQQPAPAAPGQQAPAPDQGIRVRGLAFQLATTPTDVFVHDAVPAPGILGAKLDLKVYLNHEFSLLPIRGKSVVITKSSDPASVKDTASVLAKATLPDNFKNGIFMFLPGSGATGATPYRVLVIDDSTRAFPRGSYKVMNLSPATVRIQLEKETFEFKSGEMKLIEDPPTGENQSSGMRAFSQLGSQWQKIGSGIWPHPGDKRGLQVLFENPGTKQIQLQGIRDVAVEY